MLTGGLKHGIQTFDRKQSSNYATMLTLAVLALAIPSLLSQSIGKGGEIRNEELSLGVAVIMMVLYILALVFSLRNNGSPVTYPTAM